MKVTASELLGMARSQIQAAQIDALGSLLSRVLPNNRFYREKYSRVEACSDFLAAGETVRIPSLEAFSALPFTERSEIENDQLQHPPYGTNLSVPLTTFQRVHQTSGSTGTPVTWLDTAESWSWWKRCWKVVLEAAGVTAADRVFVPFSFGPFIGFWGAFEAAMDMGAVVLPAGGMSTLARLAYLRKHEATVVCCTPTYALRMIEVAEGEGVNLSESTVSTLIVAGEPGGGIANTRQRIEQGWGARVFDHVGMTEIGAWGFETIDEPRLVFVNELEFVAEVVDSVTGETLYPRGENAAACEKPIRGELVLTNPGRWESPLIRYRTGDLVEVAPTSGLMALKAGVIGRTDDMIHVRGVNVFPSALENVLRGFDEVAEFQIFWDDSSDSGTLLIRLECTTESIAGDGGEGVGGGQVGLSRRIEAAIRDAVHVRPAIEIVSPDTLPRSDMKSRRFFRGPASG